MLSVKTTNNLKVYFKLTSIQETVPEKPMVCLSLACWDEVAAEVSYQ